MQVFLLYKPLSCCCPLLSLGRSSQREDWIWPIPSGCVLPTLGPKPGLNSCVLWRWNIVCPSLWFRWRACHRRTRSIYFVKGRHVAEYLDQPCTERMTCGSLLYFNQCYGSFTLCKLLSNIKENAKIYIKYRAFLKILKTCRWGLPWTGK